MVCHWIGIGDPGLSRGLGVNIGYGGDILVKALGLKLSGLLEATWCVPMNEELIVVVWFMSMVWIFQ